MRILRARPERTGVFGLPDAAADARRRRPARTSGRCGAAACAFFRLSGRCVSLGRCWSASCRESASRCRCWCRAGHRAAAPSGPAPRSSTPHRCPGSAQQHAAGGRGGDDVAALAGARSMRGTNVLDCRRQVPRSSRPCPSPSPCSVPFDAGLAAGPRRRCSPGCSPGRTSSRSRRPWLLPGVAIHHVVHHGGHARIVRGEHPSAHRPTACRSRLPRITFAPCSCSARAMPRPMPLEPPVM